MRKKLSSIISIAILMALLLTDVPDLLFDNYLSPVLKFLATRFIYPSTFFNVIDLILGTVFTWFVVLFFFAWLIHRAWINENSRPGIRPADMPILRPIPIPTKNRRFYARLLVWLMEPRRWEVGEHWCYSFENGDETIKLIVPRGFVFDGASIPRLLWFFLSPTGLFLIPGLIHDYGYKYGRMWPCNAEEGISKFPLQPNPGRCYWDNLFFKQGYR